MGISMTQTFSWWESQGELPVADMLGRRAARRATFLARSAAYAIESVGGFEDGTSVVFGSCLGNIGVTMELLEQFYSGDSKLSPIRFMNSVHHAPVSHVSIAADKTGFVTAVAAAQDLCAVALMESIGVCLQRRDDVVLVLCEERWPGAFTTQDFEPYAGAVRLEWVADEDQTIQLDRVDTTYSDAGLPEAIQGNPAAQLEHIIAWFDEGGDDGRLIAPSGDGSWRLSRT